MIFQRLAIGQSRFSRQMSIQPQRSKPICPFVPLCSFWVLFSTAWRWKSITHRDSWNYLHDVFGILYSSRFVPFLRIAREKFILFLVFARGLKNRRYRERNNSGSSVVKKKTEAELYTVYTIAMTLSFRNREISCSLSWMECFREIPSFSATNAVALVIRRSKAEGKKRKYPRKREESQLLESRQLKTRFIIQVCFGTMMQMVF